MMTNHITLAQFCAGVRRKGASAFCLFLFTLGLGVSASAQEVAPALNSEEVVLHNFASPPNGAYPANGVILDEQGNLYGTTNGAYSDVPGGGTNNAGVVFKIDPSGKETVLYSFTGGADGGNPGSVILNWKGNLYGSTGSGGAGYGVVFKLD